MAIDMSLPSFNYSNLIGQAQELNPSGLANITTRNPTLKDKMRAFGGKFAAGAQNLNGKLSAGGVS